MRTLLLALFAAAACAAPSEPVTTRFAVHGMVCDSCEQAICAEVKKLDGVSECSADHAAESAEVRHDPARASADQIAAAIQKLGYTAAAK